MLMKRCRAIAERRPALRREVVAVGRQAEEAVGLVDAIAEGVVRGEEDSPLRLHVVQVDAEPRRTASARPTGSR